MGMRMWRMLVALLGVIGVAALAPQFALADAPIGGQVTDAVTGAGISGVIVNLYNASTGMEIGQGMTLANGDYSLATWPSGTYQLQFVDGGGRYAQLWYNGKQSQSQATPVTVGSMAVTVNQALQPDKVTGQVTDQASGQPISGVEVELLSGSGTKVAETTSDAGGNYSFSAIPAATYEVAFNPGDANTNYNSSYYGGASPTGFQLGESQTVSNINGQLITDGAVTGQLTDRSSGQPISGIEVELLNESGMVAETTTDGGGNYRFAEIQPGTYEVAFNPGAANASYDSAYYGGASAATVQVNDGQTTQNINGQLITGAAIGGTVTNSAHQPVSGVGVQIMNPVTGDYHYLTTGADGTYLLDGLAPGGYQILFQPGSGEDYVYQYYPDESNAAAAQPVAVTAGQTSPANATLATAATVSGKVTDAATGAPIGGVRVFINSYGGGGVAYDYNTSTTTDADGNWSIVGLSTGTYQVEFDPEYPSIYAFQYYNDANGEDPATPVTLTAGTTTSNIDGALITGGQISGTVTNGMTGAPAAGVYVTALDSSGEQWSSTTTDGNGNYTLPGLSPSASYRVEFSPPSGSPLASEFYPSGATVQNATPVSVTVGQTTPNIDETLSEGGSISGVVTDAATGYPIGGVRVMITDGAGAAVYFNEFSPYTEPDGSYDVTNLPPGSYKVEFSSEGALGFQYYKNASTLSAATAVTVSAGQAATDIDGALTEGGTIKGRVTDASTGRALADAEVDILDARGDFLNDEFTDANGQYTVSGIAPGTYYVEVMPDNNDQSPPYQPEFYAGSGTLAGATPVTVAAGATTNGINVAVSASSGGSPVPSTTTTTTTTATTPTPPAGQAATVTPGPPTLSGGSVSGLGKGKPVVKFRLASGSNGAHKLKSFKVKLPAGLAFVAGKVGKGVKVTGGGRVTEKLTGGQLVVTLGSAAKVVTVSISSPALKVTAQLEAKAASKKAGALKVTVTVTPVNGTGHVLSFTARNPS